MSTVTIFSQGGKCPIGKQDWTIIFATYWLIVALSSQDRKRIHSWNSSNRTSRATGTWRTYGIVSCGVSKRRLLEFFGDVSPDAVTFHSLATGYRGLQVPSVFDGTTTPMDFRCVPLAETAVHNIVTCGYSWDDAEVALWCPESFGMGVGQRILEMPGGIGSFSPEEACYFVLWGDPQEGYFCPEPWVGGPNAFNEHKGLVQLSAGERFVWEMLLRPMFDPPW